MEDYVSLNRDAWNKQTDVHLTSDFYDHENFLKGRSSLNPVELSLLGDVKGKSILHLQCHFGQDSISLARMGAHVTGVDLSDRSIQEARKASAACGQEVRFVESDVLTLDQVLNEQFDIVFTSYGTIGWLPDLEQWSGIVAHFLKPGGRFIMVDFHPVVWMMDEDFSKIKYSYFNRVPIVEEKTGSYTDGSEEIQTKTISWNHDFGELLGNLVKRALHITHFSEYDYAPYPCFNKVIKVSEGKYQIEGLEGKIPMLYAIEAMKP